MRSQQGVVIVIALFIVALVASMAYVMMARVERDTRRTMLLVRNIQADNYAQGSVDWAKAVLKKNWEDHNGKQDVLVDTMPLTSPMDEVNGYKISSTIQDMQSRYNINNLTKIEAQADFINLLKVVDPTLIETKRQEIAKAVSDWVSGETQQTIYNQYYLELSPAYRAPHQPMVSVSELRLVKGMTAALFNALEPYVTALPKPTLVNVQTASAPVLTTLSPTISLPTAQALEAARQEKAFTSPNLFLALDIVKNHPIPQEKVTTTSQYFLVETDVTIENQHVLLYTLLERTTDDSKVACNIIWQSKSQPG